MATSPLLPSGATTRRPLVSRTSTARLTDCAALFLVATVFSVLRTASLPRDDRLVSLVELVERRYPILRRFDVTEKVSPTTEDRRQELEEQYVSGAISDAEFEREIGRLMDGTASEESSNSGTETTIDEKSR